MHACMHPGGADSTGTSTGADNANGPNSPDRVNGR